MKVLLLSVPVFYPHEPYLAAPTLKAFLESNGYEVEQRDVNALFFDRILSKTYLEECAISLRGRLSSLRKKGPLNPEEKILSRKISSALASAAYLSANISRAKSRFQRRKSENKSSIASGTSRVGRLWSFCVMQSALDLISLRYYPSRLSFNAYSTVYSPASTEDLFKISDNARENIFFEFFEEHLLPELLSGNHSIIGISINDHRQIIAGLTLARLIKKKGSFVVIGGSVFTKELQVTSELFDFCSAFVIGDGELPLLSLLRQIRNGNDLSKVPNLAWFDDVKQKVVFNESVFYSEIDHIPAADFDGLDTGIYLDFFNNAKRFPVMVSKGCYWNRCVFCDIIKSHGYRSRGISLIINDILSIIDSHGITSFFLVGESLDPAMLKELSAEIIKRGISIEWEGYARFEAAFDRQLCDLMSRAGCKKLYFGFESGSQKVLDYANKGIDLAVVSDILACLRDVGIGVHLFVLMGLPNESVEDVELTFKYFFDNKDIIDTPGFTLGIREVRYSSRCEIVNKPDDYRVEHVLLKNPRNDLEVSDKYSFLSPSFLPCDDAKKLVREFKKILTRNYYYYGLRSVISGDDSSYNFFGRASLLVARLIFHYTRHAVCKCAGFIGIKRKEIVLSREALI
jgi:anaerobic magnesium-protoporphyrin IX monomethyl ester cyclase